MDSTANKSTYHVMLLQFRHCSYLKFPIL